VLTLRVSLHRHALRAKAVGVVRHRVNAGSVNPPVVEVEQRAHRHGEIDRIVCPACFADGVQIRCSDSRGVVIDLVDEPEQRLVTVVQRG
jgi:hypothetical protein